MSVRPGQNHTDIAEPINPAERVVEDFVKWVRSSHLNPCEGVITIKVGVPCEEALAEQGIWAVVDYKVTISLHPMATTTDTARDSS